MFCRNSSSILWKAAVDEFSGHLDAFAISLVCMIELASLMLLELKFTKYKNQAGGDWKRLSCYGNRILNSRKSVACKIISLSSSNCLCLKLTKILYLYSWCNTGLNDNVISPLIGVFIHQIKLNICVANPDNYKQQSQGKLLYYCLFRLVMESSTG